VWLQLENTIPIHEDFIWNNLSFTKELPKNSTAWTGKVRGSLTELSTNDGSFLFDTLLKQANKKNVYPLSEDDVKKIKRHKLRTHSKKELVVSVPDGDIESTTQILPEKIEQRDSIKIQALIAELGEKMGMRIWIPRSDRSRVLDIWNPKQGILLESLPLNYDEATLNTIEQIDVLWLRRRSIVRAFEVEHSTAIYSGILRMADLLALQPNLEIKAHIVAPEERKEKVFQEITRPVFTLLEKGPLYEICTFISYDAINKLVSEKHLIHMSDSVLDEYAEFAED